MGADEVAVSRPRVIKKEFKALGRLVKESGAQVIFHRSFQWWAETLSDTGRLSLLTHGSVTGVTATTLGSLTMG